MTRDEIIKLMHEAGVNPNLGAHRFAALVAQAEREAMVAIVNDNSDSDGLCCADDLLAAIRARGEK